MPFLTSPFAIHIMSQWQDHFQCLLYSICNLPQASFFICTNRSYSIFSSLYVNTHIHCISSFACQKVFTKFFMLKTSLRVCTQWIPSAVWIVRVILCSVLCKPAMAGYYYTLCVCDFLCVYTKYYEVFYLLFLLIMHGAHYNLLLPLSGMKCNSANVDSVCIYIFLALTTPLNSEKCQRRCKK